MKDFQSFDYLIIDRDEGLSPDDCWYVGVHNLGDWDKDEVLGWFLTEKAANDYANSLNKKYRLPIQTSDNLVFSKSDILYIINGIIEKNVDNNKLDYLVSLEHFSLLESISVIDIRTSSYNARDNLVYHIIPILEVQAEGEKNIVEVHLMYLDLSWEQNSTINVISTVINGEINQDYVGLNEEELHSPLLIYNQDDEYENHDDVLSNIISLELISELNIWSMLEGNNKLYSKLFNIISEGDKKI